MGLDVIKWIKGWRLDKLFHSIKDFIDKVAISATEAVKTATEGTVAQNLAAVLDAALNTHLATDAIKALHIASIQALAVELAIKGVPDDPSADDILAFEKEVWQIFTNKTPQDKSKIWTTFAAQLYGLIHDAIGQSTKLTFAEIVAIIEKAYQDYKADQAAGNN